ncbi:MAG: hypothetical protein NTU43_03870 [Bacteroidetes bacterium]|nr:hypothetical protein [Bacteroidota bacterium]
MCSHSDNTKEAIDGFTNKLYPAILHQFSLITTSDYYLANTFLEESSEKIYFILKEMKTEFQSLITYEKRLVFPSILNAFDDSIIKQNNFHPNINDLLVLTKHKENRLSQLVAELINEINLLKFIEKDDSISSLVDLMQNDFVEKRHQWNNLIHECLHNCICLKKTNNSEINTLSHE